ncbi:hypothetical protein ABPG74_015375 [Tetrahymena malaccensis]
MYWDMGVESMKMFFKAVQENFTGKSLRLTKQVQEERKKLELTIVSIRPRIDQGLQQMEAARKELKFLKDNKDAIEKNKNFQYTYKEQKFRKVDLPAGVYTTTCQTCNRTCHENCVFSDNNDKSRCSAITDGYCTVCPNKCYWTKHFNLPFKYEYYYVEELRNYEDLKKRYYEAQNGKNISDQVLDGLSKDLKQVQQKIYNDIETMCSSLKKLDEIALKPNPYSSTEMIDLMIQQEQTNKQEGYLDRIQGLNDVKQKYQILSKLTTSNEKEKALKEFFSSYQNTISELDNINKGKDNSSCSIF